MIGSQIASRAGSYVSTITSGAKNLAIKNAGPVAAQLKGIGTLAGYTVLAGIGLETGTHIARKIEQPRHDHFHSKKVAG